MDSTDRARTVKILEPTEHMPFAIDEDGTRRFVSFLDRNFPGWRLTELFREKNSGSIRREWASETSGLERVAIYRGEYVEISDESFQKLPDSRVESLYPKNILCSIDGDVTPVAVWRQRRG